MPSTQSDRITGISTSTALKAPVSAVATTPITLSGEQTIGAVAVAETSPPTRVLVAGQSDATENGIYDVSATAWTRSPDFDGSRDAVKGTIVTMATSTDPLVAYRLTTANPIIIGTTALAFEAITTAAPTPIVFDPTAQKVHLQPGVKAYGFGDSITSGNGASATRFRWINKFGALTRTNIVNLGVGGRGVFQGTWDAFLNLPPFGKYNDAALYLDGHNDVYRGGTLATTLYKIQGCIRAFLCTCWAKTSTSAASASSEGNTGGGGGTWSSMNSSIKDKASQSALASHGRFTQTDNDFIEFAFDGDNVVIYAYDSDGVNEHVSPFTYSVDGVQIGTYNGEGKTDGISDGNYDNRLTYNAIALHGFGDGAHTLRIVANVVSSRPVYISCVDTLLVPNDCRPVFVGLPPRPNTAGYSLGGGIWSPAAFDAADAAITEVVSEFINRPVALPQTNDYLDSTAGLSVDNEHPNDIGHDQIAQAFAALILTRSYPIGDQIGFFRNSNLSIPNGAATLVAFDLQDYADEGMADALNNERAVAPYPCDVEVSGVMAFASSGTGQRQVDIYKNGVKLRTVALTDATGGSNPTYVPFTTVVRSLASGDYIQAYVAQSSGGALNLLATDTRMSVRVVRGPNYQ